jgi:hypothetical protein
MLNYNQKIKPILALILCISVSLTFVACKGKKLDRGETISPIKKEEGGIKMAIKITSTAFAQGEMIPKKYSCDGERISPPLKWKNIPEDAKSLVLISDDPDAPFETFVHWVVYDIPASISEFPENVPSVKSLEDIEGFNLSGKQGINSGHKIGYYPPCPPSGTHRYFFKIYALDIILNLKAGASKKEIVRAMEGHILAQGQLMGRYKR